MNYTSLIYSIVSDILEDKGNTEGNPAQEGPFTLDHQKQGVKHEATGNTLTAVYDDASQIDRLKKEAR